jgi:hypothetical protein
MQVMQGAVPAIGSAFSAGFGNDEAYNRLKAQAQNPSVVPGLVGAANSAKEIYNSLSQFPQQAKNLGVQAVKDYGPGIIRNVTSIPGIRNIQVPVPQVAGIKVPLSMAGAVAAQALPGQIDKMVRGNPNQPTGPGMVSRAATGLYNALPNQAQEYLNSLANVGKSTASGIAQGAADQITRYESGRAAANYALPVVDFFRNNPWAKWALGGAAALGAYGLGRGLFGGEDYDEENAPQTLFNQGYGKVYQPRALRVSE